MPTMHTKLLRLQDVLGPEDLAQLRAAAQQSLGAPAGALVSVPLAAFRKLEAAVDQRFEPQLEAVRQAERMPSADAVKLRIR